MDQGNNSLIRKTKPVHTSKGKSGFHSFVPISRQMSRYFVGSLLSAYIMIAWEDKHHNHECPSFLLLSLSIYCWTQYHTVWNIPLISWGQLSQLCPLPTSGSPPAYFLWGAAGKREWLDAVQALFSNSQTVDVLSTNFYAQMQKHSTTWAAVKEVSSIPARSPEEYWCCGYRVPFSVSVCVAVSWYHTSTF